MNAYHRPGYSSVSASESHLLQVVGTCHPLSAQVLAAEDRHSVAVMQAEQIRRRREARAMSGSQAAPSMRLRQSAGSALVRLGVRLAGTPNAAATTGAAS
jgi:hypothetical protein